MSKVFQLRLSEDMHNYVKEISDKLGMSQNSFVIMLMLFGKKIVEDRTI